MQMALTKELAVFGVSVALALMTLAIYLEPQQQTAAIPPPPPSERPQQVTRDEVPIQYPYLYVASGKQLTRNPFRSTDPWVDPQPAPLDLPPRQRPGIALPIPALDRLATLPEAVDRTGIQIPATSTPWQPPATAPEPEPEVEQP